MPKGSRKRVGNFSVGDRVSAGSIVGIVESFPSRRIASVKVMEGEIVEVSTFDLRKDNEIEGHD
jgi:hypothetical protein